MAIDRSGFEVLSDEACLALLRTHWLGRLGVSIGALPAILPVAYAVDGRSVVFRTLSGSKLESIGRGDVVCFEVDEADRTTGSGWSVLIVGQAHEVTDPRESADLDDLCLETWPTDADRYVRLDATVMSGRRIQRCAA